MNKKRSRKIRFKLLSTIMPVIIVTMIVLVVISAMLSSRALQESANGQLASSINNQSDNIYAWLDKNLESFESTKRDIEAVHFDDAQIQAVLDSYAGINPNAPEGLFVGTVSGDFLKAAVSEKTETNVVESQWFKEGISRISMNYGSPYINSDGKNVISASGILNDGTDNLRVIAADVTLDQISIIVNSGVNMKDASSFLINENDGTILAHRDASLLSQHISDQNTQLMQNVAKAMDKKDFENEIVGDYMIAYHEIQGMNWLLVSYIPTRVIMSDIYSLVGILIAIGAAAVILISAIVIFVVSRVIAPISHISRNIAEMSSGDFTIDIKTYSNDEIGQMSGKISEFVATMRGMIASISEESVKLKQQSDVSDEVSRTMYDASQSQAEAMGQLNDTVDQLALAVNEIAQNATTLAGVASDTRANSEKADESMRETVAISQSGRSDMEHLKAAMSEIQRTNNELVDSINKVGAASDEITNIVGLIRNIAEETNLLSLNASIEAARAGEAGRGFAVVASEIGKLAQTSAGSAQNISNLISEVQKLIGGAVGQANESAENIRENSELIETAVETFDRIYQNIQHTNELIAAMIENVQAVDEVATNVAAISEEQAASADEILATSQNMVEQANHITKSSQDVADNAHELASTSDTLTLHVSRFKI